LLRAPSLDKDAEPPNISQVDHDLKNLRRKFRFFEGSYKQFHFAVIVDIDGNVRLDKSKRFPDEGSPKVLMLKKFFESEITATTQEDRLEVVRLWGHLLNGTVWPEDESPAADAEKQPSDGGHLLGGMFNCPHRFSFLFDKQGRLKDLNYWYFDH
jgi:hypothetical protein